MPADFLSITTYDKIVVAVVKQRDRLTDAGSINELDQALQGQLDRHPRISLLLDIGYVEAMSSQMLGKLVALHKQIKKGKGRFVVAGTAKHHAVVYGHQIAQGSQA